MLSAHLSKTKSPSLIQGLLTKYSSPHLSSALLKENTVQQDASFILSPSLTCFPPSILLIEKYFIYVFYCFGHVRRENVFYSFKYVKETEPVFVLLGMLTRTNPIPSKYSLKPNRLALLPSFFKHKNCDCMCLLSPQGQH